MQTPPNTSFKAITVQIREFSFKQINELNEYSVAYDLVSDIKAEYVEESNNMLIMRMNILFNLHQLDSQENKSELAYFSSDIRAGVLIQEDFNPKILNNVAAILYSYLRPLIAQMTVMAKIPPLDIPPMNLTGLKIDKVEALKNN